MPALDAHTVAAFCVALLCKRRANSHCERAACRTHCRLSGECAIKSHVLAVQAGGQQVEDDYPSFDALQADPSIEEPASASAPQEPASTHPQANLPSAGISLLGGGPAHQSMILPFFDNHSFVRSPSPSPGYSFLPEFGPSPQPIAAPGSPAALDSPAAPGFPRVHTDPDPLHQSVIPPVCDNHSFIRSPSSPGRPFLPEPGPSLQPIAALGSPHAHTDVDPLNHSAIPIVCDNHSFIQSPSPGRPFLPEPGPSLQPIAALSSPHVHTDADPHQSTVPLQSPSPIPSRSILPESGPSFQPILAIGSSHIHGDIKLPLPIHQDSEQLLVNVKNTVTVYVWKRVSASAFYRSYCSQTKFIGKFPTCPLSIPEWISVLLFLLCTVHSPSSWPFWP